MPATSIRSDWESGSLVFYEDAVGRSVTGDLITFATTGITVGNTSQDADLKVWLGTAANYGLFDCGNKYLFVTITQTSASPGTHRAIVGKQTTFTSMTSGNVVGVRGEVTLGGTATSVFLYGVQGKIITGAQTIATAAAYIAGVFGQLDVSGGTITTCKMAGLVSDIYGAGAGSYMIDGVYVEHVGGGVINSLFKAIGKSDYVFDLASNTHTNMSSSGTPGACTGATGWIKCLVEGAVRYIPLSSSVS
jgi:hypothetical protein